MNQLNPRTLLLRNCSTVLCLAVFALDSEASFNLVGSGNYPAAGNLVVNGSFESGHPGAGGPNQRYWAAGTTLTPFQAVTGWTGIGQSSTYAMWGSDQPVGPFTTRGSDYLPDGQTGVYFGNGGTQVSLAPTFHPDYSVTFPGIPSFTLPLGGTANLWQSVPTHLNSAPKYGLSFWVSGEGALYGNPNDVGIFGLRVSNTLPGDPILFYQVPSGSGGALGPSHVFKFEFVPLVSSSPVVVEFINFGHFDLTPFGGTGTTELVLDDVRVVTIVPEPGSFSLLMAGALVLVGRRRHAGV